MCIQTNYSLVVSTCRYYILLHLPNPIDNAVAPTIANHFPVAAATSGKEHRH